MITSRSEGCRVPREIQADPAPNPVEGRVSPSIGWHGGLLVPRSTPPRCRSNRQTRTQETGSSRPVTEPISAPRFPETTSRSQRTQCDGPSTRCGLTRRAGEVGRDGPSLWNPCSPLVLTPGTAGTPPNVRVDRAAVNQEHHPSLANAKRRDPAPVQRVVGHRFSQRQIRIVWFPERDVRFP